MDKDDITINISDSMLTIDTTISGDFTYNINDININSSSVAVTDGMSWTNVSDLLVDTIDLSTLDINILEPVEFEDNMPSVAKIEDMCNDYPALAKAYENFKTIYKMVEQDWKGRQEENEPPF